MARSRALTTVARCRWVARRLRLLRWLIVLWACAGCADHAVVGGLCGANAQCATTAGNSAAADAGADACGARDCGSAASSGSCSGPSCKGDAGANCSDGEIVLTRRRLDLIMVVDDSASLAPWLPWLHDGLDRFLLQERTSGLGVGLSRFDDVCEAAAYRQLIVPIAPLPDNAAALEQASALMATASTSTIPALDGVLQHAQAWARAHDNSDVAVVLLTDGSPGACDGLSGDYDGEAQRIARAAHLGTPSIKTYVVVFSVLATASAIAVAGGTTPLLISVTPGDDDVLIALEAVRTDAQPCAFQWPSEWRPAPNAEVVVEDSDASTHRYPILADRSTCDQEQGFYVQDPQAAYPLMACPSTCEGLHSDDRLALSRACSAP